MAYEYWKIEYTSCEGNYRWTVAKAPSEWDHWDVRDAIPMGGVGDDVADIISVETTSDTDYSWDLS